MNRARLLPVLFGGSAPDLTRPTCTITSASSGTTAGAFDVTITFSESVTGFAVGDITCSANASAGSFSGSGTTYTATITPTTLATVTVDVAEGVCADAAGNTNTAATQFSILNTSVTAGAITPSLGSEALANAGFEGTYDTEASGIDIAPDWNNLGLDTGTDTATKETTTIHGGSASQGIVCDAANEGIVTAATSSPGKTWQQVSFWAYVNSGQVKGLASSIILPAISTTGQWLQSLATGRGDTFAGTLKIDSNYGAFNGYIDDASIKPITLSSMLSSLGALTGTNGAYTCHPTLSAYTQCGMAVAYKDASNFVIAYLSRTSTTATTAFLTKFIGGTTWTAVISGAVTYGAAKELKVVVSGTSYSLYYDNIQVGTTQTISDTLGTGVYGFNSYAGNTVGVVTAVP